MTGHFYHEGFTRAMYLSNGDILLIGARKFDAANPQASRSGKNAELWVMKKDLSAARRAFGREMLGRAGRIAKENDYRLDASG